MISTGAVDETGAAWDYTQNNDQIELTAPGVGIESALPNNRYGFIDGTSAAAPHVSGVAALVWSHQSDCSNGEIRDALQRSALDKGATGRDDTYGHGLVQAKAAADLLASEGCDANVPNVIVTEPDPDVFTGNTDVDPVGDISGQIPSDVVLSQGYARGIGCSSTGGVILQSSNRRFSLVRGHLFFNFDVGV